MTTKSSSRKTSIALMTVLLVWSASAGAAKPKGTLRYTVVVDQFENKTENPRALGNEWSTLLTSALYESGHFIVVSQSDMQLKALKEQMRGASGTTVQGRKTAQRAQMTPAQLLIKGLITHFKAGAANQGGGIGVGKFRVNADRQKTEIRATLQMIDATTGALVAARNFVGAAQARAFSVGSNSNADNVKMGEDDNVHQAFEKAIAEAIPWMVEQLPSVQWRGSVVKVDKERIIVNRGAREGVSAGDEFIAGESEILRDPDTGEVLDEIIHERARMKVVTVSERTSICSLVSGNIGQIVERMAIQYREN